MLCFACQVNIKVIATKNALHFFEESALHVPVLGEQDGAQVLLQLQACSGILHIVKHAHMCCVMYFICNVVQ